MSWRSLSDNGPGVCGPKTVSMAASQDASLIGRLIEAAQARRRFLVIAFLFTSVPLGLMIGSGSEDPGAPGLAAAPATTGMDGSGETAEWHDPALGPAAIEFFESRVTYWVGLYRIGGLSGTTPPGTEVEIWATWEPPITDEPRAQRLIRSAYIEKVIPPITPDGTYEIALSLARKDVPNMIYGERYGQLSAAVIGRWGGS